MSDGPFKNAKLPRWWKAYMDALINDALTAEERRAQAAHAVLEDVLTTDNVQALFSALHAFASRRQLEIDAVGSAESIFENYVKTPFTDLLQKQMAYRLAHDEKPDAAFPKAMADAVSGQIEESRTRSQEECIHAADVGNMKRAECDRALERTSDDFSKLSVTDICDAALAGDKKAFKNAVEKQEGVEDGPPL